MRRRRSGDDKPGSPLWMTTYADMVTNLMALFVLLYAFSELDLQRFERILSSFQEHAGVLSGGQVVGDRGMESPLPPVPDEREAIAKQLRDFVEQQGLGGSVEILPSEEGVTLSFSDKVMFDSGKAELRADSKRILKGLGTLLAKHMYRVRVEGHTDNVPISNAQFPSNWELSVYRASAVVRFLEDVAHISSRRLSAVGYGEYRPVVANSTPDNRRRNRRVDIIVLVANMPAPTQASSAKTSSAM